MIRTWRGKLFWSAVTFALGSWAVRMTRGQGVAATGRDRKVVRKSVGRVDSVRPYAVKMASKAGRAMMDTTMRTVRSLSKR